jgi:hypothetical protein
MGDCRPTSFISGLSRAISVSAPPAMIVSDPAAAAGGPPETGTSTQLQPVFAWSRREKSRHSAAGMVEKSTTSCGGRKAVARPVVPKTAVSTA